MDNEVARKYAGGHQGPDEYAQVPAGPMLKTNKGHKSQLIDHKDGISVYIMDNNYHLKDSRNMNDGQQKNHERQYQVSRPQEGRGGMSGGTGHTEHQLVRRDFGYVVRKAEKLTTALYLVTDIMSEKEPLKWKVRESGVELLSDITMASTLPTSEKMSMLRNIMKKTEKTIAFLDVAHAAHLMTEMNASMLKKEYLGLKDSIESEWGNVYEKSKTIFSDTFFDVPRDAHERKVIPMQIQQKSNETHGNSDTAQLKDIVRDVQPKKESMAAPEKMTPQPTVTSVKSPETINRPAQNTPVVQAESQKVPAKTETPSSSQGQSGVQSGLRLMVGMPALSQLPSPAAPTERLLQSGGGVLVREGRGEGDRNERSDRRKIILALIKQKPALTVRDITKSIPQVSEKTIQRELLAMVSEGTLLKRGERRWSTYSLRSQ